MAKINKKFRGHRQDDLVSTESFSIQRQMYEESSRTQTALSNENIKNIRLDKIKLHEDNIFNYRDKDNNSEGIKELADNIELEGLVHNIAVTQRPGESEYIILSGERRYLAYKYLKDKFLAAGDIESAKKYRRIPCRVIEIKVDDESVRRNAEQIYIDSANAFTREGISDGELFEKVAVRFVKNLTLVYKMSEKEARRTLIYHLNEASGRDKTRKVDRSLEIYRKMIPELYELYRKDNSDMTRETAKKISSLDADRQRAVLDAVKELTREKKALGSVYPLIYGDFQKKISSCRDGLSDKTAEEICKEIKRKITSTKAAAKKIADKKENLPSAETVYTKNYDAMVKAKNLIQKMNKKTIVLAMKDAHEKRSDKDVLPEIDAMIRLLNNLRAEIEG